MKNNLTIALALLLTSSLSAVQITFSGKGHGEIIDTDFAGLTISATGGTGKAAIFDSTFGGTTEDTDLLGPIWAGGNIPNASLGNLLIVQDDQRPSTTGDFFDDPDDNVGSELIFDFSSAISSFGFDFVDIESSESLMVEFFSGAVSDSLVSSAAISTGEVFGNRTANTTDLIDLSGKGIDKVVIKFSGSGAVDNIRYNNNVPDNGASIALFGLSILGLALARRRLS